MQSSLHRVCTAGILGLLSSIALAHHPDPSQVRINEVRYAGTGCPQGTASVGLSEDAKVITIAFDQFTVSLDPQATHARPVMKNCNLDIGLHVSPGWSFGIFSIDARGYADIGEKVLGTQELSYRFDHENRVRKLGTLRFKGPTQEDYTQSFDIPMAQVSWSPCNSTKPTRLLLNSEIALRPMGAPRGGRGREFNGLLTVDTVDGEYQEKYGVAWRECEPSHHADQGIWVQTNGLTPCQKACKDRRLQAGADSFGAECVSGEARPTQAQGLIDFSLGCYGGCAGQGNISTKTLGIFCYQPGQKKDADKTDRIVGCYCRR